MTNQELILLPVLAMVLLTFLVSIRLFITRIGELRTRRVRPQEMATRTSAAAALKTSVAVSDNFLNLFELPVLFYVLSLLLYAAGMADVSYVALGCAYVALRYVHSFIHVTYNRVIHRFYAYIASAFVLWVMWARFGWQIIQLLSVDSPV